MDHTGSSGIFGEVGHKPNLVKATHLPLYLLKVSPNAILSSYAFYAWGTLRITTVPDDVDFRSTDRDA